MEAIGAPLAWGCAIGDSASALAVVDDGFPSGVGLDDEDLLNNIAVQWRTYINRNRTNDHGTRVASVLGARGNNGKGISGAMWRVDIRPYDVRVDLAHDTVSHRLSAGAIAEKVERGARAGARIHEIQ